MVTELTIRVCKPYSLTFFCDKLSLTSSEVFLRKELTKLREICMLFFVTRVKKKTRLQIMDFYTVAHHDVVDCNPHVGFEFVSGVAKDTDLQGNYPASSIEQFPKLRTVSIF
jgi:hypothetical protein